MNRDVPLVWIDDAEGRPRAITPKQKAVYALASEMIEGEMLTMHEMGKRLGVAPSTVSRTLAKLSAWGILAYIVGRGRYAGLVIIRRVKGDGLDRFRRAAQERVKRWSQAAERRISRLRANVASYVMEEGRRGDSLSDYVLVTVAATLKPWTPQEIEESLR